MDPSIVYSIIQRINQGEANAAEIELESHRRTSIDGLVLALLSIINDQQDNPTQDTKVVGILQSALLILKSVVPKSWGPGFHEFKGPAISPTVKSALRSGLFKLLGFNKSKVRSVAALLISNIVSSDYSSEWPDLFDRLVYMLHHGQTFEVFGAISTVKELLISPISNREFARVGPYLISALFHVASNQSDNVYSFHASANAIEVFRECIEYFLIAEETGSSLVDSFVVPVIDQWSPLFIHYIAMPADPTNPGFIDLKLESLKTYKALLTALPTMASGHALNMFEATLNSTHHILPTYEKEFISTSEHHRPQYDHTIANNVFFHFNLTLDSLVLEHVDYLCMAVELESIVSRLSSALPELINLLVRLGQISANQEECNDDTDDILLEETESSAGRLLLRPQIAEILILIGKVSAYDLAPLLWNQVLNLSHSATWRIKESGLNLFSRVLAEGCCNTTTISQNDINQFIRLVSECQRDANPLLRSRAYLSAASVCRSLPHMIDPTAIQIPLFDATVETAVSDPNDTVRISCILAICKCCVDLPSDYFCIKEPEIYNAISLMAETAEDYIPAILAEVLIVLAECDLSRAARNPGLITLLYSLALKDPTNVMLGNEVQDIMAEITARAAQENVYSELFQQGLAPVVESITALKTWEYTPELYLSLSVLGVFIANGPYPLPALVVTMVFEPLHQIIMNSADSQVLHILTEVFALLTEHAPDQIQGYVNEHGRNGLDMLVMAVNRLLGPAWLESACSNTGLLILSVVQTFGAVLGHHIPAILEGAADRLSTAKDPVLTGSLIMVFSKLVCKSPETVVDVLSSIEINGESGLEVMLTEWLANFDVLRANEEIQEK